MRFLLTILVLLGLSSLATAGDYYNGFQEDGYTYSDGYWYLGGLPYTRTKVIYTKNIYQYGSWYPQSYYYWNYQRYYPPTPNYPQQAAAVDYSAGDWRSRLLGIAEARDKYEGQLRKAALEQSQFLEGVRALGLQGNFTWQGYGTAPAFANFSSVGNGYSGSHAVGNYQLHVGNYGVTGQTVYGFTPFSQLADGYGSTDVNLQYQQAAALAKNAQDLGGQATTQFSALVDQAGSARARVVEILAKGQAAASALTAASAAPSITTLSTTTGSSSSVGGGVGSPVPGAAGDAGAGFAAPGGGLRASALNARQQQAATYCVGCHAGASPKGGYDVTRHWSLTPELQLAVAAHLMADSNDPKFMPRAADGKAGARLSPAVIAEFLPKR